MDIKTVIVAWILGSLGALSIGAMLGEPGIVEVSTISLLVGVVVGGIIGYNGDKVI